MFLESDRMYKNLAFLLFLLLVELLPFALVVVSSLLEF
jgi:hypothetical protein